MHQLLENTVTGTAKADWCQRAQMQFTSPSFRPLPPSRALMYECDYNWVGNTTNGCKDSVTREFAQSYVYG